MFGSMTTQGSVICSKIVRIYAKYSQWHECDEMQVHLRFFSINKTKPLVLLEAQGNMTLP